MLQGISKGLFLKSESMFFQEIILDLGKFSLLLQQK